MGNDSQFNTLSGYPSFQSEKKLISYFFHTLGRRSGGPILLIFLNINGLRNVARILCPPISSASFLSFKKRLVDKRIYTMYI